MKYYIKWKSVDTGVEEQDDTELDFDEAQALCLQANLDWEGSFFHWVVPGTNE